MAKKKKNKAYSRHLVFHTRKGFYSLFTIAVLLLIATIKIYTPEPNIQSVLGRDDNKSGKNEENSQQKREEKTEEIKREFRVTSDGLKVNFKKENGKVERKVVADDELSLDKKREDKLADEIEQEFEDEHNAQVASESSDIVIRKNKIKARTGFPLSIDLATNQLIVTRPDGTTKVVAILPDQAVANFMRHKKINLLNVPDDNPTGSESAGSGGNDNEGSESAGTGDDIQISTDSSTLTSEETQVTLKEREGLLVYEIKGKKRLRVLGIIPVNVDTTGFVSAETGEVVDQEESIITRLLNLISI